MFDDREMTVLLTLSEFNEDTELPQPKNKTDLYQLLRTVLEDHVECDKFLAKWKKFQPTFLKVEDADDKKNLCQGLGRTG